VRQRLTRFLAKEQGATAIEYGMIASFIAIAIVGVLLAIGPALSNIFMQVQNNL